LKSPLRYPGGKTRALKHIIPHFPDDIPEMVSPFLGGGSIELHYAAQGTKVHAYDVFEPLINFWQQALLDAPAMAHILEGAMHPISKAQFKRFQERVADLTLDPHLRACAFYAINRSSFSGATLSGGMSNNHPRYTQSAIDRLASFSAPNLTAKCLSFEDSLALHDDDTFIYADPPYLLESNTLYGNKGSTHKHFNHALFAATIKKKNNWIISYNPHPEILDLYRNHVIEYNLEWKYGMSKDKTSKEILIINRKGN